MLIEPYAGRYGRCSWENLERLKEKVSSFQDYHLELSIGSEWMKQINAVRY